MDNAIQRLKAARRALVLDHPFYGMLALKLTMTADTGPEQGTMGTDGQRLYYDTKFVKSCTDDELIWLWAHEVMHPALHHHTRRGERDPDLWNQAADYAENPIIEGIGTRPKGSLLDPRFKGQSAEQIYATLDQERQQKKQQERDDPQAVSGQGDGQGDPAPGGVLDAPDKAQDAAEWTVAVQQAANAAQMMGKMPGAMKGIVEEMVRPRVDWRSLLHRWVQQICASDYTWKTPNRRYMQSGLYLPTLRSEHMGQMLVFIDSSGSTRPVLPAFKAELQAVKDEMKPEELIVVMVDAEVQSVERFGRDDPVEFNVKGFGGTDFRPAFEWAEREGIQPACAIYLTDGDGRFPTSPPDYPVLWAIAPYYNRDIQAPWGETVRVEVD